MILGGEAFGNDKIRWGCEGRAPMVGLVLLEEEETLELLYLSCEDMARKVGCLQVEKGALIKNQILEHLALTLPSLQELRNNVCCLSP